MTISIKNKNTVFWILHFTGWLGYYAMDAVKMYTYKEKEWSLESQLLHGLTFVVGFLITWALRYLYRKMHDRIENFILIPVLIIFISFIISNLWHLADLYISHFFWPSGIIELKKRFTLAILLKVNFWYIIVITAWSALYFGIKYFMDWQTEKKKAQEATLLAQKAQMEMLRYQLNPHFLFNSLNSIRALVDENQQTAKTMITELSEFLRYSLLHRNATFVTLSNELEAVIHYFSIEKKRFEEKLNISYKIAPETENVQILSFLLHPLIENAVKYGMKTSDMPLRVNISTQKTGYGLMIEVCNSGKWFTHDSSMPNKNGTGTGLNNVEKRLLNAYKDGARFEILKGENNICIRIEIKEEYLYG